MDQEALLKAHSNKKEVSEIGLQALSDLWECYRLNNKAQMEAIAQTAQEGISIS